MDLVRNMRLFVRLAETMSFSSAARAMAMSVGTVSRNVSDLEAHLQTRLLQRTTRRIALTHAGKRYLVRCNAILASLDEAEAEVRTTRVQPAGELKIQASSAIGRYYIVPAIGHYREIYPDVRITLALADSPPVLLADGFHIAILAAPAFQNASFASVQLGRTCSVLCAAPGYLKSRPDIMTPADLSAHPFVGMKDGAEHNLTDPIELVLSSPAGEVAVPVRPGFCVNSMESTASALELGMGIGALPLPAAIEPIRMGRLARVLPEHTSQTLSVFAIFPSTHYLDVKVRTWLDLLKLRFQEAAKYEQAIVGEILAAALSP